MPDNSQKADWANAAIEGYRAAKIPFDRGYEGEPMEDNIRDLLTDLMHLCRREGIDFASRLSVAEMNVGYED